ncbi:MAG: hypothetical protein IPL95_02265 [Saprospiraceae bacterium]|nr:hypothetical protein [Saprospiraceae bacterium]
MTKKYFTSLIFLFSFSLSISVYSQNLVNNPGFETLGSLYSHTGAEKGEMNALMKNWSFSDTPFLVIVKINTFLEISDLIIMTTAS